MDEEKKLVRDKGKNRSVYVIDEEFRIIYSNDELKDSLSGELKGKVCYEEICRESDQCRWCPLREENGGKSVFFNKLRQDWVSVSSAPVELPGIGKCNVFIAESMVEDSENIFHNMIGKYDYDEMIALNYRDDAYSVVYHGEREQEKRNTGKISSMVEKIAKRSIHPEDRERFYELWLLNHVCEDGVPPEIMMTRCAEFRKRQPDGSYVWVQQMLMPVRQNSHNDIFVMNFYNIIDDSNKWNQQFANSEGEILGAGLYNKQYFFKVAEEILKSPSDNRNWCMISIDIENLKLFNEWYGRIEGNRLIQSITDCLNELKEERFGIAGYFGNDDFALMMEYDREAIERLYEKVLSLMKQGHDKMGFMPAFGVYEIKDANESAFKMYDFADLARASVKGNYNERIKKFDTRLVEKIESEYILLSEIQKALEEKEFTFFLQPKCNMRSGKVIGAEALVRWNSKEKGMISPGIFIPFLENAGLIAELDAYIWEEVCKWQRELLDRGARIVPVSVNVSRIDIYSMNVPEYFEKLIKNYRLDTKCIEIEITESAFAENNDYIGDVVDRLRKLGFDVLLDDFGSGYSSLNMLKDVEVDVLKLDMRFLDINQHNAKKGIGIIETISNLANLMRLKMIAEGVETEEQKNFLLKMGCIYGQGYYFYRPLPKQEFERLIGDNENLESEASGEEKVEKLVLKDLLNENIFNEMMLHNMLGAVAFYEVFDGHVVLKQYNENYMNLLGCTGAQPEVKRNILDSLTPPEKEKLFLAFDGAEVNRNEGEKCDVCRIGENGESLWLRMRIFFLSENNNRRIYYSSMRDVTDIYRQNEQLRKQNELLISRNRDMPGGYYRHKHNLECDFLHISERFLEITGFTEYEIQREFDNQMLRMIHPEDREKVREGIQNMERDGGNFAQLYRIRSRNGYIRILDQSRIVRYEEGTFIQGIILNDISGLECREKCAEFRQEDIESSALRLMPCGIFCAEAGGGHQFTYVSSSMLEFLGYSREAFDKKFHNCSQELVYEGDLEAVGMEVREQMQKSNFVSIEYRIEMADGSLKWVYSHGRLLTDKDGQRFFYTCIVDSDYVKAKYQEQEWQQMKYRSLVEIPGMFVYDYEPEFDRLTVERSDMGGRMVRMVTDKFVENLERHEWLGKENLDLQRRVFQCEDTGRQSGTVDFRGCFEPDGVFHWYRSYYRRLLDESGRVYRIVGRADNIDEHIQTVSEWKNRAMRDLKTSLLNNESAKKIINEVIIKFQGGTLFLMDVDNFKQINDSLGHLQGDFVLKSVAEILRETFRKEDIKARFGGDEFLVYMPGVFEKEVAAFKAEELLGKIHTIRLDDGERLHCSIGITVSESDNAVCDTMIHQADMALYRAKQLGKDRYEFFG